MKLVSAKVNLLNSRRRGDGGYVLVGVLLVATVAMLISVGMLQGASSTLDVRHVVDVNTKDFYDVERSINAATA